MNINIKFKLNNPNKEFLIGLFCHTMTEIEQDENEETYTEVGIISRLVLGLLIFSIEIYFK
jgi:hypothetical protein